MDYLFLIFAGLLALGGLGFTGYFIFKIMRTPHAGAGLKAFNRVFLVSAGLIIAVGIFLAFFSSGIPAGWGIVLASGGVSISLLILAVEGFGIGFKQMEEDGVGFLRFFQIGSSIEFCLSLAPAFFAFITFATVLQ